MITTSKKKNYCFACFRKDNLTVHHIIPLHTGGLDSFDNTCFLCVHCHRLIHNNEKEHSNYTDIEWIERLYELRVYRELARQFNPLSNKH